MAQSAQSGLTRFAWNAGLAGIVIAAGGILGVQLGLWAPMVAFGGFVLGTFVCGSFAMIGGAISLFRSRKQPDPADQKRAFMATGLGMLLVAIVFIAGTGGAGAPPINDISTDLVDPPAFASAEVVTDYAGRDMAYPAEFVPIVETAYPDLQPIQVATDPGEAYARALASARALGWTITYEDPAARTFDATEQTAVFRFVDDVTVRVRPDDQGARIDIRSKSRDGRGDLGANAERIRRFNTELTLPPVSAR